MMGSGESENVKRKMEVENGKYEKGKWKMDNVKWKM